MKTAMRSYYILFALLLFCGNAQSQSVERKWKLIWSDEFNYSGLPDSAKWAYEVGYLRDGLKQYYTKNRLQNARVTKGSLVITARKERMYNYNFLNKNFSATYPKEFQRMPIDSIPAYIRDLHDSVVNLTSASLISKGKFQVQYGKIEIRASLPKGSGVFPAIWMLGNRFPDLKWPFSGEIDIMEFIGNKEPNTIFGGVHYADPLNGLHVHKGGEFILSDRPGGYHVFSTEWDADQISFSCDGQIYFKFKVADAGDKLDNPYNKPFFFLINLALGGWAGYVDESNLPQQLKIDYIRVYQKY